MTAQPSQGPFSAQPQSQKGTQPLGELVLPPGVPDKTQIETAMLDLRRGETAADRVKACEVLGQNLNTASAMLLCEAGLFDRDARVVDAAIAALRGIQDPAVLQKLESMLFEGRGEHAMTAAKVLRGTTYEPIILKLANKLREPALELKAPRTWSALLYALGEPKHPVAIRAIIQSAEKCRESQDSAKAILALKGCADSEVLLLICNKYLTSMNAPRVDAAVEVLCGVDNPKVIAAILKSCGSGSSAAIRALAGTQNNEALEYLFSILGKPKGEQGVSLANHAMRALRQSQSPKVAMRLMATAISQEYSPLTRSLALQALAGTRDEAVLKLLFLLLAEEEDSTLRCEAINSVRNGLHLKEASVLWTQCIFSSDTIQQIVTAQILKGTENEKALLAICQAGLTKPVSQPLAKSVVEALKGTKNVATLKWLTEEGLESPHASVRQSAALALEGTQYAPAVLKLATITLSDPEKSVRPAAAMALHLTQSREAQDALCNLGLNDEASEVRALSARALAGCRQPKVIEKLFELVSFDTDRTVREAARWALEMVTDQKVQKRLENNS
jgi:HEAT repeat protein